MRAVELDAVLLILARDADPQETAQRLTERVRALVVAALRGQPLPGLTDPAAAILRAWVDKQGGSHASAGAHYEELLNLTLERRSGEVVICRRRGTQRPTGTYYTGAQVLQYMVERAHTYMHNARTVLDPACGSGAFLVAIRNRFGEQVERLVGLDSDPLAVGLCRTAVPQACVYETDALLDEVPGGYDLCLGNPPYISSGLRGAAAISPERLAALRVQYPASAQYKLNTYPLFIERGLDLLRVGGVLGFILPDSFLTGRYFERVRRLLLQHTVLELTLIRADFWQHGLVGQSVILFVCKEAPRPDHTVLVKVCDRVEHLSAVPAAAQPVADVVWGPLRRFRLIANPQTQVAVKQMESAPGVRRLGDLVRTYSGLIGRYGQESLLRSANPEALGPWGRLIRSGREIDRYGLHWIGEEVVLDPALIKSGGRQAYYASPKLLMRQTADALRAVYDDQGFYCLNNVHLLVPRRGDTDLRLILGFLNSGPVNLYYQTAAMEVGRLYAQVDLDIVEGIPIPPLSEGAQPELAMLVRQREKAAPAEAAVLDEQIDWLVGIAYGLNPHRLRER